MHARTLYLVGSGRRCVQIQQVRLDMDACTPILLALVTGACRSSRYALNCMHVPPISTNRLYVSTYVLPTPAHQIYYLFWRETSFCKGGGGNTRAGSMQRRREADAGSRCELPGEADLQEDARLVASLVKMQTGSCR